MSILTEPPARLQAHGGRPSQTLLGDWRWPLQRNPGGRLIVRGTPDGPPFAATVLTPVPDRLHRRAIGDLPTAQALELIARAPRPRVTPWELGDSRIVPAGICQVEVAGVDPPWIIWLKHSDARPIVSAGAWEHWGLPAAAWALEWLSRLRGQGDGDPNPLAIETQLLDAFRLGFTKPDGFVSVVAIRAMQRALGCRKEDLVPDVVEPSAAIAALRRALLTWIAIERRGALGPPVRLELGGGQRPCFETRAAYLELEPLAREGRLAAGYVCLLTPTGTVDGDVVVGAAEAVALKAACIIVGALTGPRDAHAKRAWRDDWLGLAAFLNGRLDDLCGWFAGLAEALVRSTSTARWIVPCRQTASEALEQMRQLAGA